MIGIRVVVGQEFPPELKPYLGKRVERAWTCSRVLAFRLEGDGLLYTHPVPEVPGAIFITGGQIRRDHDFSKIEQASPQTIDTLALRGRKFQGYCNNLMLFGGVGVRITDEGPRWERVN